MHSLQSSSQYDATIFVQGKPVFVIKPDGRIVLGEGASLDEASLAFWQFVQSAAPKGWKVESPNEANEDRNQGLQRGQNALL